MQQCDNKICILAIESSCDETAAAVISEVDGQPVILSNVVSSQIDLHTKTGGVVPEVASREHMETINPVIALALLNAQQAISNYQLPITNQNINSKNSKTQKMVESNFEIGKLIGNWKLPAPRSSKSEVGEIGNYQEAIALLGDLTHIAVTSGPGLIGSLLVGVAAAKTMAYALDLPVIPINHIEGHIYSAFSREIFNFQFPISNKNVNSKIQKTNTAIQQYNNENLFPLISLTVSGGHTSLVLMKDHGDYELVGQTIDDAVGEAYDKVAKLLGLGYPGGPEIAKYAERFRNNYQLPITPTSPRLRGAGNYQSNEKYQNRIGNWKLEIGKLPLCGIVFPRPMMKDGTFNFSFSGLKTAVLVETKKILVREGLSSAADIKIEMKEEIAAAFEEAVSEVLSFKLVRAIEKSEPKTVVFAGGVSANGYLRDNLAKAVKEIDSGIKFLTPAADLYGDNAAMIGLAAYHHIKRGETKRWDELGVDANLALV